MKRFARNAPKILMIVALCTVTGCDGVMTSLDSECTSSQDCPDSLFCKMGECTELDDPSSEGLLGVDGEQRTTDAGTHGADTGPDHPCPDAPAADAENLVLNEFLANVPAGDAGDANQDGERHFHDDEFVELVNTADETIDLTDVTIANDEHIRFTFDEICLEPLHAVVVFGGIEIGADPPSGDGFESFVSETWFRYAQDGGRVVVNAADGDPIADISYDSHPEGSLNRDGDLDGQTLTPHSTLSDGDALFSPGTCANGEPFPTGCTDDATEESDDDAGETSDDDDDSAKSVPGR